ncbi:MAG: hypothetical protein K2N14_05215, partial [Clostridia bacterium]|nr:hypothetical protein [Clostridia bacterium]
FTVMLCCILIIAACLTPQSVYAASPTYARANGRNAYFFTEKKEEKSLFAVPYTYCVEVLRDDGDGWYYVRYASDTGIYKALYGYCRTKDFTPETGVPEVTYLYKTVTVNYTATNSNSSLPVLSEIALEAAYYGTYYAGATVYSYVYCQGSFGYIVGSNDDYPLNNPAPATDDNGGGTDGKGQQSAGWNAGLTAFAVIAVLTAAVVIIILFTTRRPKAE